MPTPRLPPTCNATGRGPAAADAVAAPEPALLPAAGPAALRELHRGQPAAAAATAAALSATSTPTAAGPTIWPTRPAIRKQSLALLDWWEMQLRDCYQGRAAPSGVRRPGRDDPQVRHPRRAVRRPAGRPSGRTSGTTRYETIDQLLDYCRYSANPVGRLVLYLGECHTPERVRLSDSICTGLQLANFCQDVARDWDRGPDLSAAWPTAGGSATTRRCSPGASATTPSAACWPSQVDQAEGWLRRGLPLVGQMPHELRLPVALFVHGGLAIARGHPPAGLRRLDAPADGFQNGEAAHCCARCWWRLHRGTLTGNEP